MKKIFFLDVINFTVSLFICRWIFMDYFYFEFISIFGFPASGVDFWRPISIILIMSFVLFTLTRIIYTQKINLTSIKIIYVLYIIILIYALLFKNFGVRGINLNILSFISDTINIDSKTPILNILIFIPLGALFKFDYKKLIIFIIAIFIVEAIQYLFSLGFFDVGDILTNTIGFIIGNTLHDSQIGKKVLNIIK